MFRFFFEDTLEPVFLRPSRPFGPWDTKEEAMHNLCAEFGAADPSWCCYVLLDTDCNCQEGNPETLEPYTYCDDHAPSTPLL